MDDETERSDTAMETERIKTASRKVDELGYEENRKKRTKKV